MGINYILGGPGSGKTTFIINKILNIEKKEKNVNIIYLVPEQFTLVSEKEILSLVKKNTMIKIKVLSFQRLAYHFFSKVGFKKEKILDDVGKIMLIRKILLELRDKFSFYKKIKVTEGFIKKLSKTITELYNFSIKEEDIKNIIDNNKENSLNLKMKDIYLIYNLYCDYIFKEYLSTDEALDILAKDIEKTNYFENHIIFVDGFTGFTAQEYKVLNKLMEKSLDVYISLINKENKIFYKNISSIDLFYETKYTINKLTSIAQKENIKINEPIYLNFNKRHENFEEFLYLEENFFNFKNKKYEKENNNIKIYEACDIYEEINFLSKMIVKLIKEDNYKYSDIGIVVSDINLYENILEEEFCKHKIPIFIDKKEEVLFHPVLELIQSYLDIIIYNFSYESIFRFLKTGFTDIKEEEIDILENYVLEFGIKGSKWKKEWTYGFDKYNKEEINIIREKVLKLIFNVDHKINKNKLYKVEEISIFIFNMLININIEEKINNLIIEAENFKDNKIVKYHSQILSKVSCVFEKIVEVLGQEKMTIKEFTYIVESCFLCEKMAIIPPKKDQAILADSERSKIHNIKALFVLGVNEGVFPKIREDDTLFTDEDKIAIRKLDLYLGKSIKESYFYDNFIIYNLLLKPKNLLILTYNKVNLEGKPIFPSFIINRLKAMFCNIFIKTEKDIFISDKDFIIEEIIKDLNNYVNTKSIKKETLDIYKLFIKNKKYKNILEKINKIIFNLDNKNNLKEYSIKKLYGKEINMTISKFEKYVECPFSFFLKYNLNLKERNICKISNKYMGNIFHKLLDKIVNSLYKDNINIDTLDKIKINNYINNFMEDIINSEEKDIFLSGEKSDFLLEKIRKISKKSLWAIVEHMKKGDFCLHDTEVDFGINNLNNIVIDIDNNHKFIFSGIIDRIDVLNLENKKYIKIIDYKSGNKKFDLTDIYYGMQLQLLLYLKTVMENSKNYFNINDDTKVLPAGVFYFNIGDFITEIDKNVEKNEIESLILENYKMSGIVLENKEVINSIDKDIIKSSSIINVSLNKDGAYSKKSSIIKEDDFYKFIEYSLKKIKEIGNNLISGNIEVIPFKKLDSCACKYCRYNSICKFDNKDKNNFKYNIFLCKNKITDII